MPHASLASLWLTSGEHVAGSSPTYLGIGWQPRAKHVPAFRGMTLEPCFSRRTNTLLLQWFTMCKWRLRWVRILTKHFAIFNITIFLRLCCQSWPWTYATSNNSFDLSLAIHSVSKDQGRAHWERIKCQVLNVANKNNSSGIDIGQGGREEMLFINYHPSSDEH